jgi:predicted RNA-binding protein with PUA-like domain
MERHEAAAERRYWLVKTEPESWSWQDQERDGTTHWDGVRNAQAAGHLKAMQAGDRVLFYHSGKERAIVGVCEVVREHYPDPADASGRFGMVDLKAIAPFARPVTLAEVKADPRLHHLDLVRQSRLSVMPIDEASWAVLCDLGGAQP